MKRFVVIAACGLACGLGLSACSSLPSWMQFDLPKGVPSATTMQFESEPAGAEARTSNGQSCRTPCSLAVSSNEFTVSFSLQGYQPQTVPVKVVASTDVSPEGETGAPRLVPNPVFVELAPMNAPPRRPAPAAAAKPRHKPKPVTTSQAGKPAPQAMAPSPPPPEAAPASPWPPAPAR